MSSKMSCLLALLLIQVLASLPTPTSASPVAPPASAVEQTKRGVTLPLIQRRRVDKRADISDWLVSQRNKVNTKYGVTSGTKRDNGVEQRASSSVTLSDLNSDGSYSLAVSVGTPAQSFEANLDTGSADFWLVSSACPLSACTSLTMYDTNSSSTYAATGSSFSISYGSGAASGSLGTDTVTVGDYTVAKQTLGVVTSMDSGLLSSPNSGLMGMGFQGLAISGATPWWQTLATSSAWTDPLFGVQLARFRDVSGASSDESSGGTVTLGFTDSSLYSGSITYVDVTTGTKSYWNIPIGGITSQGTTVSVGSSNAAAVDTGTTLIGGPSDIVASIYAAIDGSEALTGSLAGYYGYPCSTSISLVFTFGGFSVTVGEDDFNIGTYSSDTTMCTGGVYAVGLSSSSPVQWVVGATLLKNVYSVYRYNPAAVGFASLAGSSTTTSSTSTVIPTASLASVANTTSAVTGTTSSDGAAGLASTATTKTSSVSASTVSPVVVTATQTAVTGSATASASTTASETSTQESNANTTSGAVTGKMMTVTTSLMLLVPLVCGLTLTFA